MAARTFATLGDTKEFLSIEGNDDDALLSNLLKRTTKLIQDYLGRKIFLDSSITEFQSGDGRTAELILNQYPITAITSVYDDPNRAYGSGTLLNNDADVDEGDYLVIDADDTTDNPGIVLRLDGNVWSRGQKNIKVIYAAGYADADIPETIKQAQIDWVAFIYQHRDKRSGIKGFRLGQFAITYDNSGNEGSTFKSMPLAVKDALDMYKDYRVESTENITGNIGTR